MSIRIRVDAASAPFHLMYAGSETSFTLTNPLAVQQFGEEETQEPAVAANNAASGDDAKPAVPPLVIMVEDTELETEDDLLGAATPSTLKSIWDRFGSLSVRPTSIPRSVTEESMPTSSTDSLDVPVSRLRSTSTSSELSLASGDEGDPDSAIGMSLSSGLTDPLPEELALEQILAQRAKVERDEMNLDGDIIDAADASTGDKKESASQRLKSLYSIVSHVIAAQRFTKPSSPTDAVEFSDDASGARIVSSGTIDGLVDLFATDGHIDMSYVHEFLSTYRYFISAPELLEVIIAKYKARDAEKLKDASDEDKEKGALVRLRLLNVLRKWLWRHPRDFENDPALEESLRAFVINNALPYVREHKFAQSLLELLQEKTPLQALRTRVEAINTTIAAIDATKLPVADGAAGRPQPPVSLATLSAESKEFLNFKPKHVARQLTLVESEMFRRIDEREMVMQVWSKKDRAYKEAPNLMRVINWFNHVSYWCATEVCQASSSRQRGAILRSIIEVAHYCYSWKAFGAVFEIVCGLSLGPVARLHKTWKTLPSKTLAQWNELNELVHPAENFKMYRRLLRHSGGAILPYIGVHLTDLTFAEDGQPTVLANGRVNFFKFHLVGGILNDLLQYQQDHFAFKEDPKILKWMETSMHALPFADLSKMSRVAEPIKASE